jgi:tRNA nucleotidyltransferase/poly(A) polymerase
MVNFAENFARRIVERLQGAGHVAYFAGGCVRDRLLGRLPKDFDVATSARPEEVLKIFPRGQQVGAAFGVILLVEKAPAGGKRLQVEVATFRTDGKYSDGRHPDSVEFTTAEQDARRRDFTCNGLFWDPLAKGEGEEQGKLHDFVGGQADIAAKILRAIGDPEARFREDHLRMLRAVRFAARLGFAMEAATAGAIRRQAPKIQSVSRERVHDELALIVGHSTRAEAARLLEWTGLLKEIWPKSLWEETVEAREFAGLRKLPAGADWVMALAAMYWDITPPERRKTGAEVADALREALLLSNAERDDVVWLLENLIKLRNWETNSKAALKHLLADARWPRLEALFVHLSLEPTRRADFETRMRTLQADGVAPTPFVTGETLIKLGAVPGPRFRRWLVELYDRQLEGELKTGEEALAAARALVSRK